MKSLSISIVEIAHVSTETEAIQNLANSYNKNLHDSGFEVLTRFFYHSITGRLSLPQSMSMGRLGGVDQYPAGRIAYAEA